MCDRILVMCRGEITGSSTFSQGRHAGADHDLRDGHRERGLSMSNEKKSALSFDLRKYMMVIAIVGIWVIFGRYPAAPTCCRATSPTCSGSRCSPPSWPSAC